MSEIDTGGPAFGQVVDLRCVRVDLTGAEEWEPVVAESGGLTVRDYFAAKALQGLLSNIPKLMHGPDWIRNVTKTACEIADQMLKEREK